ncbi:proline--tRNA ligase [Sugiyamaella lignohabitans]|uniref:proline--tRNA ligase n=1 Tax=Sugiyamaella lignohabitans TaxID=796027 RepID=A0A167BXN0_9ASCO|nr:proline--tRNA ligase [Sugiyamaella lignohabitans]ANB10953.1 proline--tRNA ligase [Sugiyamaella lignohabitans]
MSSLIKDLEGLSLTHEAPANNEEWASILAKSDVAKFAGPYELTKVLVFKPKTAKTATPVPVVVVALNSTQTASNIVAKAAGVKEPRLANKDLINEFFGTEPQNVSPISITKENASKLKILIDSKAAEKSTLLAIHTDSNAKTAFITGDKLIEAYESIAADVTVVDFAKEAAAAAASATPTAGSGADKSAKSGSAGAVAKASANEGKIDGAALIGITSDKELDFPGWYQQIVTKAELLDYYDVSGCYIMRPGSYSIWEKVQNYLDTRIKSIGVQNAYFPMFVSSRVLEKEKDHIEGFAPEVAWVTKAGQSDLEEPLAIRPTSETVMYPYYAKWIRSYRDLPLRLNQWNSVVRWEFKHPQPFLRTREFLWQEGHTAHLTKEAAAEEVLQILEWYAGVYEELLAVPVIKGTKTDKEKFAGGLYTTTCEGYIPTTGRGIQGATSHALGQNFSKMFNIVVEDPEGSDKPKINVWQNSWGLSTRVIGVMVMIHSDNKGLVLPPRVASNQVAVIPVGITAKTTSDERDAIINGAKNVEKTIGDAGVRVFGDYRDNYSPGWKFADAELKGVPLRVEFGPADLKKNQVVAVRRDNGVKTVIPIASLADEIPKLLETIQADLYTKAKKQFDEHIVPVTTVAEMTPLLNKKNILLAPFCGEEECEDSIKETTARRDDDEEVDEKAPSMGAKSLCIPFEQPELKEGTKCVNCDRLAKAHTLFGRSY